MTPRAVVSLFLLLATAWAVGEIELESQLHLSELLVAVAGTFTVWLLAPQHLKHWVFAAGTQLLLFFLLGLKNGLFTLGFGSLLFAMMHLPVRAGWRMIATGFSGAGILALYSTLPKSVAGVGGLFMFRSILYLYELKVSTQQKASWIDRWNYFFFLPNLALPIFPVLDWRNFRDNWQPTPKLDEAMPRIANGILHLMAYRLLYHYAPLNYTILAGPWEILSFHASNYLLIVRLAGIFHLAIGIGGLFGWSLPRVFEHYFFARNFNDLWQRINRYWRDFVVRTIYYPIYFRIKKWGRYASTTIALAFTFLLNWFLHSWQFLWLNGEFPILLRDQIFWGSFGFLVIANSLFATRFKPRHPRPLLEAAQIAGVFWVMACLWTLWNFSSRHEYLSFIGGLSAKRGPSPALACAGMYMITLVIAWVFVMVNQKRPRLLTPRPRWGHLFLLLFLGLVMSVRVLDASGPLWSEQLNTIDRFKKFKGYYETIVPAGSPLSQNQFTHRRRIEIVAGNRPSRSFPPDTTLTGQRDDIQLNVNQHGHRGPEYSTWPDVNTIRFVLLGGSMETGTSSVEDSTLSALIESELNDRLHSIGSHKQVQIICTAVPGGFTIHRLHQWLLADSLYHPHCFIYPLHHLDYDLTRHILRHRNRIASKKENWTTLERKALDVYLKNFSSYSKENVIWFEKRLPKLIDNTLSDMRHFSSTPCIVVEFDPFVSELRPSQSELNRFSCWKSRLDADSQGVTTLDPDNLHFNSAANELNAMDLSDSLWAYLKVHEMNDD